MCLQIFLMSSSNWDIFLLSSKQESASWDNYLQGGLPFFSLRSSHPLLQSLQEETWRLFLFVLASCWIFVFFFSLKFKKISFQVDESWNRREAVSFRVPPPQGAGYCAEALISPTWGFLDAIPNVQAHLVIAVIRVYLGGFPGGSDGKESACNAVDTSSIPGSGRSPGKGNGNPLQYSWRIPWIEEPGGPQTMRLQRVGHNQVTKHTHTSIWPMIVFLGCCLFDVTPSLFLTFQYFHLMECLLITKYPGIHCFSMARAIASACLLFPGNNRSFALRRFSWVLSRVSLSHAAHSAPVFPSNWFPWVVLVF